MDRKALIREYKDTPRPMGVYRVLNTKNGKTLVGSSREVTPALNRHRAQLNMGTHPNRELQSDWNAQGSDAFTFEVLDTISPNDKSDHDPTDDLGALEEMWMEKLALGENSAY